MEREGWRRREVKWWKKGAKEIFMHVYLSRCSHTTPLRAFLFHTHTHTHTQVPLIDVLRERLLRLS